MTTFQKNLSEFYLLSTFLATKNKYHKVTKNTLYLLMQNNYYLTKIKRKKNLLTVYEFLNDL